MKTTITYIAAGIATIAAAAALTACTAVGPVNVPTEPAAPVGPSVETPAVDATVAEVEALPTGSALTAEQVAAVADIEGAHAYALPDGSTVLVRESEPLPDAVKAAAAAPLAAAADASNGDPNAVRQAVTEVTFAAESATGRKVVVISRTFTSPDGNTYSWRYKAQSLHADEAIAKFGASPDDLMPTVNAWIAAQDDPSAWDVLITG